MYKIAWHPMYVHPVPENHRFPMEKYDLLPKQLLHEGIVSEDQFFEPSFDLKYDFTLHDEEFLKRFFSAQFTKQEERASGFKQSSELIKREICITNGTIEGAFSALDTGASFNIAGGTHHAFSNKPEGFCLLNDQALAAHNLIKSGLAKQILIIDLDVHQGNGTAEITAKNDIVYTFSMHGERNYPNHKPASNLDIGLKDGTEDDEFLTKLRSALSKIERTFQPDFLFYQAGVDILKTDKLGRLSLSIEGCKQRDEVVYEFAKKKNLPIVTTMGGGYSEDIKQILKAHSNTFKAANSLLF